MSALVLEQVSASGSALCPVSASLLGKVRLSLLRWVSALGSPHHHPEMDLEFQP